MVVNLLCQHSRKVHIFILLVALIGQQLGSLEAKVLFNFAVLLFLLGTGAILLGCCASAKLVRRLLRGSISFRLFV